MRKLRNRLESIIAPITEAEQIDLVDMEIRGRGNNLVLRVFVDVDGGISIERCVALSRKIGDALEMAAIFPGKYRLEVSSPGLDRPLKTSRDFKRHLGRLVELNYVDEAGHAALARGRILDADEQAVVIAEQEREPIRVPLSIIKKALIQIEW